MSAIRSAPIKFTFPTIDIINDPSSGVADADVKKWTAALAKQLHEDFGPHWGLGAHLNAVPQGQKGTAGHWWIVLLDSSDVAGALGYHDLTPQGQPLGKVFAGTDRQYGNSVSVTLCHELLEMVADPNINQTAQRSSVASGEFWAYETCDAVEADSLGYEVDGVLLSDFITPQYFVEPAIPGAKFDHLGHLSAPFEIAPGGYSSIWTPGSGWAQKQAEHATAKPGERIPVDPAARPRVGSRRERRATPSNEWQLSTVEAAS